MRDYYSRQLSAERLRRCFELAPARVKQHLDSEVEFAVSRISPGDTVLELGCGYGRVLAALLRKTQRVLGVDTSPRSLSLARRTLGPACRLAGMNAVRLGFRDDRFDAVICIQNGIAVFGEDQRELIREAWRVTRPGGTLLFSSYAEAFWSHRLEWFRIQARHGLIGAIDEEATGDGVIACTDGFRATTVGRERFLSLSSDLPVRPQLTEVDGSSLFCEFEVV